MYVDRKRRHWPLAVFLAAALSLAAGLGFWAAQVSGRNLYEEGAASLKDAIRRGALQCYAVEGVFPPSLEYLEEHYGVRVNRESFAVSYDAFASNQPPDIRVAVRH